ncbi:hypothetical protein MICAK_720009 [Microcystis aeruginosa PCC 9701]|uniref:Transposase n=1 Tax=Microcystis aeruginosa PCC 9701 TaxID=721123 RepID=I4IX83_MICAE|nr:hypothetical protein MICAK_720009 [Microcystis aeruginosa PCC 9701]
MIKAFYERLVGRAKSKTLALTACVRKILVILNAMVCQNQPWQLPDNLQPSTRSDYISRKLLLFFFLPHRNEKRQPRKPSIFRDCNMSDYPGF